MRHVHGTPSRASLAYRPGTVCAYSRGASTPPWVRDQVLLIGRAGLELGHLAWRDKRRKGFFVAVGRGRRMNYQGSPTSDTANGRLTIQHLPATILALVFGCRPQHTCGIREFYIIFEHSTKVFYASSLFLTHLGHGYFLFCFVFT